MEVGTIALIFHDTYCPSLEVKHIQNNLDFGKDFKIVYYDILIIG